MGKTTMTLIACYNAAILRGDIKDDQAQRLLLVSLQRVYDDLAAHVRWYRVFRKPTITGLYMVGPVGSGKTYLMDLFYQALPQTNKTRVHFLRFMQQIDHQLRFLQGHSNPIVKIAAEFSKQFQVLCLDEFIVTDVAHAMILAELLKALFQHGVVLIATSNIVVDDLYRDGTNRERFLPVIALLHQHCEEVRLEGVMDYRLGRPEALCAYLFPLIVTNELLFEQQFQMIAMQAQEGGVIKVQNRSIMVVKASQAVVWFEFDIICGMPRCQLDYIELADRFHTIFVSNIPILSAQENTIKVVLLIQLIDVLYDRGIRLVILAAVKVSELYTSGPMLKDFSRTVSRLEEMQSEDYLSRRCMLK